MVFWGVILIAIGVGALVDLELWPVVLIGFGGALLGSVMLGNRWPSLFSPACCWWAPAERRDVEQRHQNEQRTVEG